MKRILSITIAASLVIWFLSIASFFGSIYQATEGFKSLVENTSFGKSKLFPISILVSMGVGVLSFLILLLATFIKIILRYKLLRLDGSPKGFLIFGLKLLILIPIFPLFLLFHILGVWELIKVVKRKQLKISFNPKGLKTFATRLGAFIVICLTLVPIWIGGYYFVGSVAAYQLGYTPEDMVIVGTGSMYPTWPKGTKGKSPKELAEEIVGTSGFFRYPNGIEISGIRYLGHVIGRGDIVTAENEAIWQATQKTYGSKSGVLKRVVALGGDTIELRDGIVYINDNPIKEAYVAKPRSTFGETFLKECTKFKIPDDSVFLMGDNRKGSGDSREFGPVKYSEIKTVLPLDKQKSNLDKNWHDTRNDLDDTARIKLDKMEYLALLNNIRKEEGAKALKYQTKLEQSSQKRGEVILKYDDFSYEASRSGYTQIEAMADVGYSNIIWNEGIIQGHFEAQELVDYFLEFPEWKKFLVEKDMQELGISEVTGQVNGCPNKVIVQHLAGYLPPNYKKEDLESWRKVIKDLDSVIPSWESVKGNNQFNQDDLNKLLGLFYKERAIAVNILSKMEANQWLSKEEEKSVEQSNAIAKESFDLSSKLNER